MVSRDRWKEEAVFGEWGRKIKEEIEEKDTFHYFESRDGN